jgi:hypothetical protein
MGDDMSDERRRLDIPDRRIHSYEQLEEHLDERIDSIEDHISKWIRRGLIAFGTIGIAVTLALIGFGFLLREVNDVRAAYVRSNCESDNSEMMIQARN